MRNPQNDTLSRKLGRSPAKAGGQLDQATPGPRPAPGDSPERTCVLTRRKGSRDTLIRLALGPDGQVGPDVRAKAPGRGAWIAVDRAELDAANAKGKLKAALARAFKTADLTVPADLGEQIERALRQWALDRLGLEARAGTLINGADRIAAAARAGQVHLLIHAADAREDGRKTLDQAMRVGARADDDDPSTTGDKGVRGVIFPEPRTILSMALGRENVVHVALTDPAAASRVSHALARWRAFTDPRTGQDGGDPASAPGSADELTKD